MGSLLVATASIRNVEDSLDEDYLLDAQSLSVLSKAGGIDETMGARDQTDSETLEELQLLSIVFSMTTLLALIKHGCWEQDSY